MPKSLKLMTLRVAAACIAATFISVGPYLHYDRQFKSANDPNVVQGPVKHPDLSHLPTLGTFQTLTLSKTPKKKRRHFSISYGLKSR